MPRLPLNCLAAVLAAASAVLAPTAAAQSWVTLDPPKILAGRLVVDTDRGKTVVTRGRGVYELAGLTAIERATDPSQPAPLQLIGTAITYDAARRQVLTFGGRRDALNATPVAASWIWDGDAWSQPFSPIAPPRRAYAAMAFDPNRQRAVMYGGQDQVALDDTWEHDGQAWTQRQPLVTPRLRLPQMVFDPVQGGCLLLGNIQGNASTHMQAYDWNGSNWVQRVFTNPPTTRPGQWNLVYEPVRQRIVMIGGGANIAELNGTTWTTVGAFAPVNRPGLAAWFDADRGEILIAGGDDFPSQETVWGFDGTRMQQLASSPRPGERFVAATAFEPQSGRAVLFGGIGISSPIATDDCFAFDGAQWQTIASATRPGARYGASMASDWMGQRALLFGGKDNTQLLADVWQLRGDTWLQLSSTSPPPGRTQAALTFDPQRNVLVLFGGDDRLGTLYGDTWEWSSGSWSQRSLTAPRPESRRPWLLTQSTTAACSSVVAPAPRRPAPGPGTERSGAPCRPTPRRSLAPSRRWPLTPAVRAWSCCRSSRRPAPIRRSPALPGTTTASTGSSSIEAQRADGSTWCRTPEASGCWRLAAALSTN